MVARGYFRAIWDVWIVESESPAIRKVAEGRKHWYAWGPWKRDQIQELTECLNDWLLAFTA